jgi:hypothetical protein
VERPCPDLPPLADGALGTLAQADADAAFEYARCKAKHQAAVDAYNAARAAKGRKK